jgi:hypothetical protein
MIKLHNTKEIIIKKAEVDEKIIPFVNWLNSFQSVITEYSCQGDSENRPYVLFKCYDHYDLIDILKLISNDCGGTREGIVMEVDMYPTNTIRYAIRFDSEERLQSILHRLSLLEIY